MMTEFTFCIEFTIPFNEPSESFSDFNLQKSKMSNFDLCFYFVVYIKVYYNTIIYANSYV